MPRLITSPARYEPPLQLDMLPLRDAVLGAGLVLLRTADQRLRLYTVDGGIAHSIGSFASAAEAWEALDQLDPPDAAPAQLAQAA